MAFRSAIFSPRISLVLASAFWAVATVISKQFLTSVPPITFLVLQLAASVAAMWLLIAAMGVQPPSRLLLTHHLAKTDGGQPRQVYRTYA